MVRAHTAESALLSIRPGAECALSGQAPQQQMYHCGQLSSPPPSTFHTRYQSVSNCGSHHTLTT